MTILTHENLNQIQRRERKHQELIETGPSQTEYELFFDHRKRRKRMPLLSFFEKNLRKKKHEKNQIIYAEESVEEMMRYSRQPISILMMKNPVFLKYPSVIVVRYYLVD